MPQAGNIVQWITLPMKISATVMNMVDQRILFPHQLFACLWEYHREAFITRLCGGAITNITKFWNDMAAHPCYQNHPMRRRKDHELKDIPLAIHGDGIPTQGVGKTWSKSIEVAYPDPNLLLIVSKTNFMPIYFSFINKSRYVTMNAIW